MELSYIIEGNSLDVLKRLEDESIDIVITSPPYNAAHNYDVYNDNLDQSLYLENMKDIFKEVYRVLKKDGRICLNVPFAIKNRDTKKVSFLSHIFAGLLNELGFNDFEWITWHKGKNKNHFQGNNTAWGSWKSPSCPSFRPMGEAVMVFFKEERRMVRDNQYIDITGDEFKEWTKNLWYFDEEEELIFNNIIMEPNTANKKEHPAPYPVALVERLLKLYSYEGAIVLDPFNGTGTTSFAAQKLNRRFIGIDLSKKYCDLAMSRLKSEDVKRVTIDSKYSTLVNSDDSIGNLNEFFPYKESFSPRLFSEMTSRYEIENVKSMYDPFVGTGSSLLNNEVETAYGLDTSPFAINVSNIKLKKLPLDKMDQVHELLENLDDIELKNYKFPDWKPYNKYVDKKTYDYIMSVIDAFNRISNEIGKYIEYLVYSNLESVFDYKRDGNGIKYRESKIKTKEDLTEYVYKLIKEGLEAKLFFDNNNKLKNILLKNESSVNYKLKNDVDLIITSPPYANMFDYFEVYKIELWTSGLIKDNKEWRELKKTALRSNLNSNLNLGHEIKNSYLSNTLKQLENLNTDNRTVVMIKNYFYDMKIVLQNCYNSLKVNGYMFIVVGNSFYNGVPVKTDFIIQEEAEKIGFKCKDLIFARRLRTSPQQMKKLNSSDKKYLRESIIVLKKE